jgi:hypothetical protein
VQKIDFSLTSVSGLAQLPQQPASYTAMITAYLTPAFAPKRARAVRAQRSSMLVAAGFQLGDVLSGSGGGSSDGGTNAAASNGECANVLLGVVRDFKGRGASAAGDASDDFEGPFWGSGPTVGLVSTLFINGNLAVDLGGLHAQATGSVSLDAQASPFGIVTSGTYNLDLFQADRHSKRHESLIRELRHGTPRRHGALNALCICL